MNSVTFWNAFEFCQVWIARMHSLEMGRTYFIHSKTCLLVFVNLYFVSYHWGCACCMYVKCTCICAVSCMSRSEDSFCSWFCLFTLCEFKLKLSDLRSKCSPSPVSHLISQALLVMYSWHWCPVGNWRPLRHCMYNFMTMFVSKST